MGRRFGLGHVPDAAKCEGETPDRLANPRLRAFGPPPVRATARHLVAEVLNQGQLGSCVANSSLQAVRASHVKQFIAAGATVIEAQRKSKLGSRLFGYYLARAYTHETATDAGTQIRNFFAALNKFGFCPEEVYPYADSTDPPNPPFARMPPTAAFRAAFDQVSPTTYERITETGHARVDAIKRAIAAEHLVVFGTTVSEAFCEDMTANGGKPIDPPLHLIPAGGHAMVVAEYDENAAGVVNSWSPAFGEGGWCRFSWDYMAWEQTTDLWIVTHSPWYST